jgi:ABC-type transporter Mla MlaB component
MSIRGEVLLNSRLRNCLLTILELEGSLVHTELGPLLSPEFDTLKQVIQRLEIMHISEDDVCRIETATARFLEELKETIPGVDETPAQPSKILQ